MIKIKCSPQADLIWNEQALPISSQFGEPYYASEDGLAAARHAFLKQNLLAERWQTESCTHFCIAEAGFGTGLNFLAAWDLAEATLKSTANISLNTLHFIGFERYPIAKDDLAKALAHWPVLAPYSAALLEQYPETFSLGCHRLVFQGEVRVQLDLWIGDINDSITQLYSPAAGLVDCWFLDGFSLTQNPDMWRSDLFNAMASLAREHCHFSTPTASSAVNKRLIEAGFKVNKTKAYDNNSEQLCGTVAKRGRAAALQGFERLSPSSPQDVAIIGAGIAGASLAYALTLRGVSVSLYDQHPAAAEEASGNRQGAIYPLLSPSQPVLSDFFLKAFSFNQNLLHQLQQSKPVEHQWCGVLQLAYDAASKAKNDKILTANYPASVVHQVSMQQASVIAGVPLEHDALFYPHAGWACPQQLVQRLLQQADRTGLLNSHYQQRVTAFIEHERGVELQFDSLSKQHQSVVFCNAAQLNELVPLLPLSAVRGQVSHLQTDPSLAELKAVLCYDGYLTPANQINEHCVGATYQRNQPGTYLTDQEHQQNIAALQRCEPQAWNQHLKLASSAGRAAVRCVVRDHLPLVGNLPNLSAMAKPAYLAHWQQQSLPQYRNVLLNVGFGSRGICSAPFTSELLASQICSESMPLAKAGLKALHPARFWVNKLLKGRPAFK